MKNFPLPEGEGWVVMKHVRGQRLYLLSKWQEWGYERERIWADLMSIMNYKLSLRIFEDKADAEAGAVAWAVQHPSGEYEVERYVVKLGAPT